MLRLDQPLSIIPLVHGDIRYAPVFSDEEISLVIARYSRLKRIDTGTIEGILDLNATYEECTLTDSFQIRITAKNPHSDRIPALYEIGGRTKSIAKKRGLSDIRDLHCNLDGSACVCVKQVEKQKFPAGSNLFVFVEELVVPYLYGLSYYENHKKWLWGEYPHGSLGLLEFYANDHSPQEREDILEVLQIMFSREKNWKDYHRQFHRPSAKRPCLCGSGRSFRKCHPEAWSGLRQLKKEIERLHLLDAVIST